jgi:hypothetical protein
VKNSLIELILEELKGIMERRRRRRSSPWFGSPRQRNEGRGKNEREREEGGSVGFGGGADDTLTL